MQQHNKKKSALSEALLTCRNALVGIGVMSLVINLLFLTGPLFMLQIYDRVLTSRSVPTLVALGGLVFVLYAFMWILDTLRSRMLVRTGHRLDAQLTGPAYSSAVLLPTIAGRRGEAIEPVSDLNQLQQFLSGNGPIALFDLPWMPIYLLLVFFFHPLLGIVGLIGAVIILAVALFNEFLSRQPTADLARRTARRNAVVSAGRTNAEVVVGMGMLGNLRRRWLEENRDFVHAHGVASDRTGGSRALIRAIRYLLQSAVLGVGAYLAINQEITPGVMIAASIITARALAPVEQAVANWRGFIAARQGARRLENAIAIIPDLSPATELPPPHQRLDVSTVSVAPPGTQVPVVRNISFSLSAGDGLGIIGPSGSGKSSLVRGLIGVWQTIGGHVRLDGADLFQWDRERLGQSIGYLPQDIELFDGTVAQNIARFDSNATSEELIAAARLANAHAMITRLEGGYETKVGENGAVLSGGQQQQVALARALFRTPFLVVLDEPSSNLDIEGERALTEAVRATRAAGSIVILIAHRPSAIAAVDKLLRMQNGQMVDFGTKEDVLNRLTGEAKARAAKLKVVTTDAG